MDTTTPVFAMHSDDRFVSSDFARGPFAGLQGGGVAALVAGRIEKVAKNEGMPAAVFAHFLRPVVSTSPLEVRVKCARPGKRVSIWEGSLHDSDREYARVRITFIQPQPMADLASGSARPMLEDPESLPAQHWKLAPDRPWLMDAMDVRGPLDGVYWIRMKQPLFDDPTTLSWILPPADWAHGLDWALAGWPAPIRAMPNPDIALHLLRPPQSRWIGVRPSSLHGANGIGVCQAMLFDPAGALGSVSMSIAIA
jgi:acyl-CoA thioesterase